MAGPEDNSNNPIYPGTGTVLQTALGTTPINNNINPNIINNLGNEGQVPGNMSNNKSGLGSAYPSNAVSAQGVSRVEPIITPAQLRSRHLFGIPLYSNQKDPMTGIRAAITDEMLRDDFIMRAINTAEVLCHIDILPVQRFEKHPFDKTYYESFGYLLSEHKPIISIQQLAIVPSNNIVVYVVPLQWIEMSYANRGQINIVPLTAAFQGAGFLPPSSAAGGAAFLQILGTKNFIASYWQLDYVSGFPDGTVPVIINNLIGAIAAKSVLENLAATNKIASYGSGIDGFNQNVNTGGPGVYNDRLEQLENEIQMLIGKVKSMFSIKMIATAI